MNYKKWPDWLKGGVIFAIFALVYWLLLLAAGLVAGFTMQSGEESEAGWMLFYVSIPLLIPVFIFPNLDQPSMSFLVAPLASIAMYSIVGAIAGFFHGRLKNIKIFKSEQQTNVEFFKKWPDWLKGGVAFAILVIIFWFFLFVTGFKF